MDTPAWFQIAVMVAGWMFGWYLALRPQQYHDMALPLVRPRALRNLVASPWLIRSVGIFFIIINSVLIAYAIASRFR